MDNIKIKKNALLRPFLLTVAIFLAVPIALAQITDLNGDGTINLFGYIDCDKRFWQNK